MYVQVIKKLHGISGALFLKKQGRSIAPLLLSVSSSPVPLQACQPGRAPGTGKAALAGRGTSQRPQPQTGTGRAPGRGTSHHTTTHDHRRTYSPERAYAMIGKRAADRAPRRRRPRAASAAAQTPTEHPYAPTHGRRGRPRTPARGGACGAGRAPLEQSLCRGAEADGAGHRRGPDLSCTAPPIEAHHRSQMTSSSDPGPIPFRFRSTVVYTSAPPRKKGYPLI